MFTKDTIRLVVQFRDFQGKSIVPESVKLTIYKSDQSILEEIEEGIIDNSNGNFHYDYVAPEHDFIFEFSSVHNNKPVLTRQEIKTKLFKGEDEDEDGKREFSSNRGSCRSIGSRRKPK